ncbi:MAG: hypothetical protein HKP48_05660 [Winogradskyella sp.]|uniref:hypothetical protein n=1 Tax=Winogradskyella sp. TaxID=1883156 RepID=UPI00182CA6FF|nr:hypothetical protein [Winogradskyella sp.]MBT8245441.1 hypothetical protein [Winogradskyella sp.]NNK22784.1 hypothetical protein [Winogradskyella sp.]
MSKNNENKTNINTNEEVDLGQLFKMIARVFQRFFNFIASIFTSFFSILILIVAHFYKRAKFYAVALVLGFVMGLFLDKSSAKIYGANMYIQTNFSSGYQVYENVNNLNQLASTLKDSLQLAELLGISVSEAAKLEGFSIAPDINPITTALMFSEYKQNLDSISRLDANYEDYIDSARGFDFNTHQLTIFTSSQNIPQNINQKLPIALADNDYLKRVLEANQGNLISEDAVLLEQKTEINTLVNKYLEIRIKESNKESTPGAGTNLFMADAQKNNLIVNEANLIKQKLGLEEQRRALKMKKATQKNIVSVLSKFPARSYSMDTWYKKAVFWIPVLFFFLSGLVFVFLRIGKYLKKEGAI